MRTLADENQLNELVDGLAKAVSTAIDTRPEPEAWALVGVRSRGDVIADRIADRIGRDKFDGRVGVLDITLYRDDLTEIGAQAQVRTTEVPFNLDGLDVVLVDDVLMTGRSIRAALQSLMDIGRPRRVWLAVLVDRGGRELPISPDFVAMNLRDDQSIRDMLGKGHLVEVQVRPTDDEDRIILRPIEAKVTD